MFQSFGACSASCLHVVFPGNAFVLVRVYKEFISSFRVRVMLFTIFIQIVLHFFASSYHLVTSSILHSHFNTVPKSLQQTMPSANPYRELQSLLDIPVNRGDLYLATAETTKALCKRCQKRTGNRKLHPGRNRNDKVN